MMAPIFFKRYGGGERGGGTHKGAFGFRIDQNISDPAGKIIYIGENKDFVPAYMDYEKGTFIYGDWGDIWFIRDLKPCMLNYDGTVAYELDPNNYKQKKDGTPSDVSNKAFTGNAMVGIPKIYWTIINNGDGTADVYISDTRLNDDFVCWSHIDSAGREIDYCYMPCYTGVMLDGKLRSLSGGYVSNLSRDSGIECAKANNLTDDIIWYTETLSDRTLINLLLLLIGKSTDTQAVFGMGNCSSGAGGSYIKGSGTLDQKGLFYGTNEGRSGVKVFGMEHYWGNMNRRIAGWVSAGKTQKIKLTYGTSDGSTAEGYNTIGEGYIPVPDIAFDQLSSAIIKKLTFFKNILIPAEVSNTYGTYYCDGFSYSTKTVSPALVGGTSNNAALAGAFYVSLNGGTTSHWSITDAVSCKPLAPA